MEIDNLITLFSSESTKQYVKDIFTVLALPRDAEYQFRYETKYVESGVRSLFSSDYNIGTKALVVFRSKNIENEDKLFVVPIRWVEIIRVSLVADFYTVTFRVKSYPSFSNEFKDTSYSFDKISACAKQILVGNNKDLAVLKGGLSIVGNHSERNDSNRENENWLNIVNTISRIPQYNRYYFLRCSPFLSSNGTPCVFENNVSTLEEEKCAYLQIDYYQREYSDSDQNEIEVIFDSTLVSRSSGLSAKMEARYDSIRLGFQPKNTMNGTLSEIIICATLGAKIRQTEITLPIRIVKRKYSSGVRASVMGFGACLVALPGLFPDGIGLEWKIATAAVGAFVMGINHFIELKRK